MSKNNPWFDDPEWESLRKKTSKKGGKRKSQAMPADVITPPRRNPLDGYVKPTTTDDLRRAMDKRRPAVIPPPKQVPKQEIFAKKVKPTALPQVDAFEKPRDDRPVQVSINLSLPTMDVFQPLTNFFKKTQKFLSKLRLSGKQLKLAGALCIVAVVGLAGFKLIPGLLNKNKDGQVLSTKVEKPTFDVSKPDSGDVKTNDIKFDPSKQVASYSDTLDNISIVVSQQPLPENFKANPFGELEKLATSFSATESFTVSDFKVYIGVSAKGPQSLILIKDKKLIFIQAQSKISNSDWVKYIQTLKT